MSDPTPLELAFADRWGSHVPLLAAVVDIARPGPVLALEVGYASSFVLGEMCRAMGRRLVAVDSDVRWLERVEGAGHGERRGAVPDERLWSVVFVDQADPHGERIASLSALRERAEFFVVHDVFSGNDALDAYLTTFAYQHYYRAMRPATAVVSDVRAYPGAPCVR
jgi:hypothetical protein